MGQEVLSLIDAYNHNDQPLFLRKHKHIRALQQLSFLTDQTYNQNPYQPGVKVGSKIVQPFINNLFTKTTQRYNQKHGTLLNTVSSYSPHKLTTNIEQLKYQPLQIRGRHIHISPLLEPIKWPALGSLTIELEHLHTGKSIEMDLGTKEVTSWGNFEVSTDGTTWRTVSLTQKGDRVLVHLEKCRIKAIRFSNISNKEQEVYLRKFILATEK